MLPSALGRTPILAIFKPSLEDTLCLKAGHMGFVYSAGTILASILTAIIGTFLVKRLSAKRILIVTYLLFSFVYVGFLIVCKAVPSVYLSIALLVLLFSGIRFCAQGMIPLIMRNLSGLFCTKAQCSWLATLHSTLLVLAVGIFSRILVYFAERIEWQSIWIIEAVTLFICPLLFVNMLPANWISSKPTKWKFSLVKSNNLGLFLLCAIILGIHNLQSTGISFHLSTLATEKSVDIKTAFSIFLPISVLGLVFNPICSWLATKIKLITLIVLLAFSIFSISLSLNYFNTFCGRAFIIVLSAIGWSFNHVICYLISPSFFEKNLIAQANTFVVSTTSLLSALGPLIMSLLACLLKNSYIYANYVISIVAVSLTIFAISKTKKQGQ